MKHVPASEQLAGGVPEYVFQPGFDDVIVTSSGSRLRCAATEDSLAIFDPDKMTRGGLPAFFFSASVEEDTYLDGARVMEASACTSHPGFNPQRHPDLYAAQLWVRAVDYFDATAPLTNVKGLWTGRLPTMSQEYDHYMQLVAKGETPEAAAWDSFLGRVALRRGFTQLYYPPRERPSYVAVNFARPLAATADEGI